LLASAPDPDRVTGDGGDGGEGADPSASEPPSLISPPAGCRFHPRCPLAMERCRERTPPRFELDGGQWAACWLYDTSEDASAAGDAPAAGTGRGAAS
ncbi:ABC transporter ATP-binding protein, partial [Streptomyces sp. S1A]|nr:ABC transporter ATP-binding protein [Streptomyces sp. ICN903]